MFDFQKLGVYQKSKEFNLFIVKLIREENFDKTTAELLRKSAMGIIIDIAGATASNNPDQKLRDLSSARAKIFECAAVIDFLKDMNEIDEFGYFDIAEKLEIISDQLASLISKLEK
jgi:four helix bundle protein